MKTFSRQGIQAELIQRLALPAVLLATTTFVLGQNLPHLGYVYPAGGQCGTAFQVVVGGQFLMNASNAWVTGDGVEATFVEYNRPMPPKEFNELRDQLRALQAKRRAANQFPGSTNTWTAEDQATFAQLRTRILKNPPNRQGNPALAETVTWKFTVAADAKPGEREIRLAARNGLSNPLVFRVGTLPEFSKPAAAQANPDLARLRRQFGEARSIPSASPAELRVSLPTVINGQITPGAVDRFQFQARRGQELVARVSARSLMPYLADAVPGWFQATLAIYDSAGRELAYDDDYRFDPDPMLHFRVPDDGDYTLEIKDAIYRGRVDFVYRIEIGELPFATGMFPLGGQAGKATAVKLTGWNLPTKQLTNQFSEAGWHVVQVENAGHLSNPLRFAVDTLPEIVEVEPNDAVAGAQPVTLPLIVNGRIDPAGDEDVFPFQGHAGDEIVVEVQARRLGSPLDSCIRLTDPNGHELAFNDDHADPAAGLETHHADSHLRATLPADGTWSVHLSDVQQHGGLEFAYRLRISPPRPDFELRVTPSSLAIRPGLCEPITVHAVRRDGFTNEIQLTLKEAPAGFRLNGARIPPGQDQVRMTLEAPASGPNQPFSLRLEGWSRMNGHVISHPAVPAEDMMQAFVYRHLVPTKELGVALSGARRGQAPLRITSPCPVKLVAGKTTIVQLTGPRGPFLNRLRLELADPPEGIALGRVSPLPNGMKLELRCDPSKGAPGTQGNLIINAYLAGSPPNANARARRANRRILAGVLPAIPFEVSAP